MKILMLGWEYPPHMSGGLGTACQGLTVALAKRGVEIDFVVPHVYGDEDSAHMRLANPSVPVGARPPGARPPQRQPPVAGVVADGATSTAGLSASVATAAGLRTVRIPAILMPYLGEAEFEQWVHSAVPELAARRLAARPRERGAKGPAVYLPSLDGQTPSAAGGDSEDLYGEGLFGEVARFAKHVADWIEDDYALVHAHDWMTFPAGIAAARMLGIPLVVHVHSLEYDRSGSHGHPSIIAIERAGVDTAERIIAVSHYTKKLIHQIYEVPLERIDVVHNGVYAAHTVAAYRAEHTHEGPIVLFLGRVTFQKGPDYFVEAAAKVASQVPNVRFVMAGAGDMLPRVKARVKQLGIAKHFEFPGFVRSAEVERLFSTADVYVMPSVSEPFGITALEAMSCDSPVILSRQSGAAELLRHVLKIDFWDVERMASQIIAILEYPELRESIVEMAREEVRRVHWDAAAGAAMDVYHTVAGRT